VTPEEAHEMIEFIIRLYSTINIFEDKQLSYEYGKFE
jgi:predicted HTH domain antitoxin